MNEITLDAAGWQSGDDVYSAFLHAVGAPSWHGRNLDALRDSIGAGQINVIEVPYRLVFRNYGAAGESARKMIDLFADVIRGLIAEGCPVELQIVDGNR
jgi:RNAse (barnase) inhibitor barstar